MARASAAGSLASITSQITYNPSWKGSYSDSDIENRDPSRHSLNTQVPSGYLEHRSGRKLLLNCGRQALDGPSTETASTQTPLAQMATQPELKSAALERPSARSPKDSCPEEVDDSHLDSTTGRRSPSRERDLDTDELVVSGPSDRVQHTFAQIARTRWGKTIPRHYKSIPADQLVILESRDSWRPSLVGRSACVFNLPRDILNDVTTMADRSTSLEYLANPSSIKFAPMLSSSTNAVDLSPGRLLDIPALLSKENLSHLPSDILDQTTQEDPEWSLSPPEPARLRPRLPPDSPPFEPETKLGEIAVLALNANQPVQATAPDQGALSTDPFPQTNKMCQDNSVRDDPETIGYADNQRDHSPRHATKGVQGEKLRSVDTNQDTSAEILERKPSDVTAPSQASVPPPRTVQVKQTPYPLNQEVPIDVMADIQNVASSCEVRVLSQDASVFASSDLVPSTFTDRCHAAAKHAVDKSPEPRPTALQGNTYRGGFEDDSSEDEKPSMTLHPVTAQAKVPSLVAVVKDINDNLKIDVTKGDAEMSTTTELAPTLPSQSLPKLVSQSSKYERVDAQTADVQDEQNQNTKRKAQDDDASRSPKKPRTMKPPPSQLRRSADCDYDAVNNKARQSRREMLQELRCGSKRVKSARSSSLQSTPDGTRDNTVKDARRSSMTTDERHASTPETRPPMHKSNMYLVDRRMSTSSVATNMETLKLQELYTAFRKAYPTYNGQLQDFSKACKLTQELYDVGQAPPKWLWDDFVARRHEDYREYLFNMAESNETPVDYKTFYDDMIDEPQSTKRVVKPELLLALFNDALPRSREASIVSSSRRLRLSTLVRPSLDHPITSHRSFGKTELRPSSVLFAPPTAPADEMVNAAHEETALETQRPSMSHSQRSSVKLWIDKVPGGESPDLATPDTTLDDIDIDIPPHDRALRPCPNTSPSQLKAEKTAPSVPALPHTHRTKTMPTTSSASEVIPSLAPTHQKIPPAPKAPPSSAPSHKVIPPASKVIAAAVTTRREPPSIRRASAPPPSPKGTATSMPPSTPTTAPPTTPPTVPPSQPKAEARGPDLPTWRANCDTPFKQLDRAWSELHCEKNALGARGSTGRLGRADVRNVLNIFTWRP